MANFAEDYIDVAARIATFREQHPGGSLQPADLAKPYSIEQIGDQTFIVVVAAAYRDADDKRPGMGMAYEQFPGRTPYTRGSELQNAETSAWGRAIVAALHEAALRYPRAFDDIQLFLAGSSTAAISSAPTVTAALRSMTSRETGSPHRTSVLVSPSPGMTFSATAPPATSEPTNPARAVTAISPAAL